MLGSEIAENRRADNEVVVSCFNVPPLGAALNQLFLN